MGHVYKVESTDAEDVSPAASVNIAAKTYSWTARIVADVPVYVFIDKAGNSPDADDGDFPVIEFAETLFAVAKGHEISVRGEEAGTVWVSEVKCSSY